MSTSGDKSFILRSDILTFSAVCNIFGVEIVSTASDQSTTHLKCLWKQLVQAVWSSIQGYSKDTTVYCK